MINQIKKRDGNIVLFNKNKISDAIFRAAKSVGGTDRERAGVLAEMVLELLEKRGFNERDIPNVEDVQDAVEKVLIEEGHAQTAKAYIIYREQHKRIREFQSFVNSNEIMDGYLQQLDWRVKENSNMSYSLQGLNNHISSIVSSNYWLHKVYPPEVRNAHHEGDFHIHDLQILAAYCCGWDLLDILTKGFGGVSEKIESRPAKHFRAVLGQLNNFLYTMQGECYSDDTEVLTSNGWKLFKDVNKRTDKAITLNPKTKEMELQGILRCFEFENKEMIHFCNNKIDLMVTPNHNLLVAKYSPSKPRKDYRLALIKADAFNPNTHLIPKGGVWIGCEKESFTLPSITINRYQNYGSKWVEETRKALNIRMEDWLAFFGFWIAEGCVSKILKKPKSRKSYYEYYTRISQDNKKNHPKIEELLKKLPLHWNKKTIKNKTEYVLYGKQLYSYLSQFGKSRDKFIPTEIKELSKKQLDTLFNWMMLGDGHISNGNYEYYTNSKKLAGDVQEIVLKLGMNANIRKKHNKLGSWYVIAISRAAYFKLNKNSIKRVNYSGKVYCVEVPNHTLYVRRNGKACWSGNSAGAQAVSNFNTLLAPFARHDNLGYKEVKQAIQEFVFNMNVPTRVGFQCPFSNVTMDLAVPGTLKHSPAVIGGKPLGENYSEFQIEMQMINKAFLEVMAEGDARGRIFSFPIPTYNITKDVDWNNPSLDGLFEVTAKLGLPYFGNFVNSDMNPDDVRSMCCRLRLDNRELRKRSGGLFAANPLTGSMGVVTLNMPRLAVTTKDETLFVEKLLSLMKIAQTSLDIKRKTVEKFTEQGLYPYARKYLSGVKEASGSYWNNHFNTIGLIGMNEACLNLFGKGIADGASRKFALKVLDIMRNELQQYQDSTNDNYNLEASPGEGCSYRLARMDKKRFPSIKTAGKELPYYTNSTHLPVGYTEDIFEALDHQDELQCKYTGGTVLHGFVGERISDAETCKKLVKKIAHNYRLPYFTITPTFSVCPEHGYLKGEKWDCTHDVGKEKCAKKCEVFSRVVGYYRPVQSWNEGKREEFKERKCYDEKKSVESASKKEGFRFSM
ncbi:MAG: ribonucleoside triphosphate reductase [Nanoarchaeota archaeon]|nr:ribonucleoside triphosphate reductase [Nanoarchaeota archaeon]